MEEGPGQKLSSGTERQNCLLLQIALPPAREMMPKNRIENMGKCFVLTWRDVTVLLILRLFSSMAQDRCLGMVSPMVGSTLLSLLKSRKSFTDMPVANVI